MKYLIILSLFQLACYHPGNLNSLHLTNIKTITFAQRKINVGDTIFLGVGSDANKNFKFIRYVNSLIYKAKTINNNDSGLTRLMNNKFAVFRGVVSRKGNTTLIPVFWVMDLREFQVRIELNEAILYKEILLNK